MEEILGKFKNFLEAGTGKLTVGTVLLALLTFVVCAVIIRLILTVAKKAFKRSKLDHVAVGYALTVARIILYFVAVIIVCDILGIPVSSLLAVLSIAGLALSLAVQDLLSNLISGFVLLVTKPFLSGDFVEVAGNTGTVTEIGLMYTTLKTPDNKVISIPNKDVNTSNIINYSKESTRRVDISVSASYDNATDEVKESILKAISKVEGIKNTPTEPFVGVKEYASSAIFYDVKVWCENADYWNVYYSLNELIKKQFDEDGVEMTYDHINVHMK